MDFSVFSSRLKELRIKQGIKQDDMAKLLDVTTNHYQKIEYGKVNIGMSTLDFLADYFHVTTDYLLGRE